MKWSSEGGFDKQKQVNYQVWIKSLPHKKLSKQNQEGPFCLQNIVVPLGWVQAVGQEFIKRFVNSERGLVAKKSSFSNKKLGVQTNPIWDSSILCPGWIVLPQPAIFCQIKKMEDVRRDDWNCPQRFCQRLDFFKTTWDFGFRYGIFKRNGIFKQTGWDCWPLVLKKRGKKPVVLFGEAIEIISIILGHFPRIS